MRILLLGGIGEALRLARWLAPIHSVTYSVAGRGRIPELPCKVRVGGFSSAYNLAKLLKEESFDLLIDATHPYAAQISRNAALAAKQAGIPLWAYRRPPWQPAARDDWRLVSNWMGVGQALQGYCRPFFTIGVQPLQHAQSIPPQQRWLVRCLAAELPALPNLSVLHAVGPFALEAELKLLQTHAVDVLISKNSGGSAVAAKLVAARQLSIPVIMLERPALPPATREFSAIEALFNCLAVL